MMQPLEGLVISMINTLPMRMKNMVSFPMCEFALKWIFTRALKKKSILAWIVGPLLKEVYYDQLPFKCKSFHEYGHFVRNFPKMIEDQANQGEMGDQWKQAKSRKVSQCQNPSMQ